MRDYNYVSTSSDIFMVNSDTDLEVLVGKILACPADFQRYLDGDVGDLTPGLGRCVYALVGWYNRNRLVDRQGGRCLPAFAYRDLNLGTGVTFLWNGSWEREYQNLVSGVDSL